MKGCAQTHESAAEGEEWGGASAEQGRKQESRQ